MKPLIQKMWSIRSEVGKPHFLPEFHDNKKWAKLYRERHFDSQDYKIVRVEVRELRRK